MSDPPLPLDSILDSGQEHLYAQGAGMEEVYQVTVALRYLDLAKTVALVTDARFSGASTGPGIGHVAPEALAGGPIGRLRDGDLIRVVVDTGRLNGSVDFVILRLLEAGRKALG